jgi:hypothetical protein
MITKVSNNSFQSLKAVSLVKYLLVNYLPEKGDPAVTKEFAEVQHQSKQAKVF